MSSVNVILNNRPSFYYDGHYKCIASQVCDYLRSNSHHILKEEQQTQRENGDIIHRIISRGFNKFLGNWCKEYKDATNFGSKAMEDFAFRDIDDFYSGIDVKTHKINTKFNMPNLTSVERLARFYKNDKNIFCLLMVKYSVENEKVNISKVLFAPIEFLDWGCLTLGALGWGQIQIANSNNIKINDGYSRKKWMLELCDKLLGFYQKEIDKIKEKRIKRFKKEKEYWNKTKDVWL